MYIPFHYHVAKIHQRGEAFHARPLGGIRTSREKESLYSCTVFYTTLSISHQLCECIRWEHLPWLVFTVRVREIRDGQNEHAALCYQGVLGPLPLSHFHLCLLTCGRLLGRDRGRQGEHMHSENPKACRSLIIQHSSSPAAYFTSTGSVPAGSCADR